MAATQYKAAAQGTFELYWWAYGIIATISCGAAYGYLGLFALAPDVGQGWVGVTAILGAGILFGLTFADYRAQMDSVRADHPLSKPIEDINKSPDEVAANVDIAGVKAIQARCRTLVVSVWARMAVAILAGFGLVVAKKANQSALDRSKPPLAILAGSGTVLEAIKAAGLKDSCKSVDLVMLNAGSLRGLETILNQENWGTGAAVMATRLNEGKPDPGPDNDPLFRRRAFVEVLIGTDELLFLANQKGAPTEPADDEGGVAVFDAEQLRNCLINEFPCYPGAPKLQDRLITPAQKCDAARWFFPRNCKGEVGDSGTCVEFRKQFLEYRQIKQEVDGHRRDANVVSVVADVDETPCGIGLSSVVTLNVWRKNHPRGDARRVHLGGDERRRYRNLYAYFPVQTYSKGRVSVLPEAQPLLDCLLRDEFYDWMLNNSAGVPSSQLRAKMVEALSSEDIMASGLYENSVPLKNGSGLVYFLKESVVRPR